MFQKPTEEIKYETHHRTSVYNPPSESYYVQSNQNNQHSEQIQYFPGRNAQYIQNPNINNGIAQGAHQFIESMYIPPIVHNNPKSKVIIQDVQYYPPDTSRALNTILPQIPVSPPILPINIKSGGIHSNQQGYRKICSCCPFGKSLGNQLSVPQPITQGSMCGCSPGFNLNKLQVLNYNPYYGYHGVGYAMTGTKFCDGIGGFFNPNKPSALCLGWCSSNINTQIGIPNISSQQNRCCFSNCRKCY